mmetsp:Transcript_1953/g.2308  ORF Transcript_1953/g.2308 Transcript_1953/m.2308 type:complete len:140 (-) Transcript_1953:984-1403(-)
MRLPGPPNRDLHIDPRGIIDLNRFRVIYDYDLNFDCDIEINLNMDIVSDEDGDGNQDPDNGNGNGGFVTISKADDHRSEVFEYISSKFTNYRIIVYFHVYDPVTESVPSFNNSAITIYSYLGLPHERAPSTKRDQTRHH